VTLAAAEMPQHNHAALSNTMPGTVTSPAANFWARDSGGSAVYSTVGGAVLNTNAITSVGGSQPHNNLAPLLTVSCCIALQGIFPSRN
jgi:microcystin-dependent protein